ncbi:LPD25 domain-containing protein [Vibrio scophthalmi]|uniref:LPD25 domain-containing protein n=1 Tax=Vibrio scophthalmi TaxID=45658 RepID=UPI003AB088D5
MSNITNPTLTPFSVLVNWSESNEFNEGEIYDFMDFEHKALAVAKQNPLGGYDKTNVTVTFENGDQHQCRLDLGCNGNDIGFADHCLSSLEYHQKHQFDADKPWLRNDEHHQQLIALMLTYRFEIDFVTDARIQTTKATKLAKQQERDKEQVKRDQEEKEWQAHKANEKAFQAALVIPEWAKGVIVATYTEYDKERSEPYSGEHHTKTFRTIILAWSTHTRRLFPELRKACLNHVDTAFLNDKTQSTEHRNNYGIGQGSGLTDLDYNYHGWCIQKLVFWNEANKAKYVPLGEMAIQE